MESVGHVLGEIKQSSSCCRRINKAVSVNMNLGNHDFSIVSVTSHRVDVLQALLHF